MPQMIQAYAYHMLLFKAVTWTGKIQQDGEIDASIGV